MNMTNDEKKTNQRLMRRRYAELKSKKQKGALLDQFCAMTGLHRKSAIRSLSPKQKHHRKRGRPFQTGMGARTLLRRIWKQAGRPCAGLLKPVLALWIESLRRAGERLDETEVSDVLRMSARTIDRRLSGVRPRWSGRSRAASLAEHRRRIPLKVQTWPADAAARIEERLPVLELAKSLGVSRRTLELRFRAETGVPIGAAILDERIARAKDLLRTTSLPCDEIAAACGISDASHLAHLFRRKFGASPSSFRTKAPSQ